MDNQLLQNQQNKNILLVEALQNNGVIFDEYSYMINLKFLDNGRNSNIFEILNTNKVLKITTSLNEYESALELINIFENDKLIKNYFEVPIVIAPINNNNNKNYIILNKLYPLNKDERKIFDEILTYFKSENIEDIYDFVVEENIDDHLEDLYKYLLKNDITEDNQYVNKLVNFISIIYTYCFKYEFNDLHVDNVMKNKNGDYKIIDAQF